MCADVIFAAGVKITTLTDFWIAIFLHCILHFIVIGLILLKYIRVKFYAIACHGYFFWRDTENCLLLAERYSTQLQGCYRGSQIKMLTITLEYCLLVFIVRTHLNNPAMNKSVGISLVDSRRDKITFFFFLYNVYNIYNIHPFIIVLVEALPMLFTYRYSTLIFLTTKKNFDEEIPVLFKLQFRS